MKLNISHLYHYVCEQLEILLIFSSEFDRKVLTIDGKYLQSKHECSGMKLEYLSYITMYVKCWTPFSCVSDFTCKFQQPMRKCAIRLYV